MVHGANKSRSRKRTHTRVTTGTALRFSEKQPGKPTSLSGGSLPGVARGSANTLRKIAKTQRRPNRPFAGVMNAKEMRSYYQAQARLSLEPSEE
ncbi:MAG: 50S ribosomal protein L34e [Candidatus Woesearchaeota archaeon]